MGRRQPERMQRGRQFESTASRACHAVSFLGRLYRGGCAKMANKNSADVHPVYGFTSQSWKSADRFMVRTRLLRRSEHARALLKFYFGHPLPDWSAWLSSIDKTIRRPLPQSSGTSLFCSSGTPLYAIQQARVGTSISNFACMLMQTLQDLSESPMAFCERYCTWLCRIS